MNVATHRDQNIFKQKHRERGILSARTVAIKTRNFPFRNAAMVCSRVFCGTSPCKALFSNLRESSTDKSLHSSLVSQNTMHLPLVPPYMAMVSEMVAPLEVQWLGMVMCRTSVEAFTALLPTCVWLWRRGE